jgi:transcriptional regulator with XRE-family HTH domain
MTTQIPSKAAVMLGLEHDAQFDSDTVRPPHALPGDVPGRLRALRETLGFGRAEVGQSAGYTARELAAIERGRRDVSENEWRAIAGSLGVDADVLAPDLAASGATGIDEHGARLDELLGGDSRGGGRVPRTTADLPRPLPVVFPVGEAGYDGRTSQRLEQSWHLVRYSLAKFVDSCERMVGTGSVDDAIDLLSDLAARVDALRARRTPGLTAEMGRPTDERLDTFAGPTADHMECPPSTATRSTPGSGAESASSPLRRAKRRELVT